MGDYYNVNDRDPASPKRNPLPGYGPGSFPASKTENIPPEQELSTLDEPILETLKRDLKNIWHKLNHVLIPRGKENVLREWDLWGPLLFCLTLALCLGQSAFSFVFVIVWVGAAVITVNFQLLGGKISFFQSVCILGYCIFPLVVGSIICLFVKSLAIKIIALIVGFAWSVTAAVRFLGNTGLQKRRTLAVYPIFLFFFSISWIILVVLSSSGS